MPENFLDELMVKYSNGIALAIFSKKSAYK